ncbi:MAG: DUF2726 domain-containing protein [Chromatiales bacterium]|nr:DUF2726 domain-containing protein [Chromatiales bacterium]
MKLPGTLLIGLIIALGVIAALYVILRKLQPGSESEGSYAKRDFLLTKAELSFFGVLKAAVGEVAAVYPKVRVADVLTPRTGSTSAVWWRAFNRISAKHFDFVLCAPGSSKVLLAVELDDASHSSKRARDRDEFLEGACKAAELPLLRVTASDAYGIVDLRNRLTELGLDTPGEPTSQQITVPMVDPQPSAMDGTPPACPKCGGETVLRTAKTGKHAGLKFWGCAAFPKCRGAVRIGA